MRTNRGRPPRRALIVSPEQLESMEGHVLLDCRGFAEYKKSHIPGAVNLDVFAFHWHDTTPGGLDGFVSQARQLASRAGVCDRRRAVFYDGTSGMLAARGLWLAKCLGHPGAAMLDGGLAAWSAGRRPLEGGTRAFEPCGAPSGSDRSVLIGRDELEAGLGSLRVVDARSEAEYSGRDVRAARGGHIPGAVNIDWTRNLNPDGSFKGPGQLRAMYGPDRPTAVYCHGGYRAANTFVAMRLAGYSDVRVYPGSWGEWGNADLPAEL